MNEAEYTLQTALEQLVALDLKWDFPALLDDDIGDSHIMQLCLEAIRREVDRLHAAEQTEVQS